MAAPKDPTRWELTDPRRRHPDHPVVDNDSAAVLDEAIFSLTIMRSPMAYGDAGAHLHALVSLIAQAQVLLADAVADAWDQGYVWGDIGRHMGLREETVRRRYFHHAYTRVMPFED